jgi:5-methylcytosine-specific restriction endonuclease McrA
VIDREAVFARDRYCAVCGLVLAEPVAVHHRKLKKHGGTDDLSNLLGLHSACHNIGPKSVHQNPRLSYEMGWLVPSWADPLEYPLTLPDGRQVLLTNESDPVRLGEVSGW